VLACIDVSGPAVISIIFCSERRLLTTALDTIKRHWSLIVFLLCLVVLFAFCYWLRNVVLPFALGLIVAYLVHPIIAWVEKRLPYPGRWMRFKRVALIVVFFILLIVIIGLFSFYLFSGVADSFVLLLENAPDYISQSIATMQEWAEMQQQRLPEEIRQQVTDFLLNGGIAISEAMKNSLLKGMASIPSTFSVLLGFFSLPLFLFYILKDSASLREGFVSFLPSGIAVHARNIASVVDVVLGRYIRAQILLGFVVGSLVFVGLMSMRIELAPALAVFAGLTELVPTIGPWIGGAAGVIVTLAVAPDKVIWVIILYFGIQGLENYLLVPRIQGGYLKINPAILIFLLVIGAKIAGFWGILLAAPLTAVIMAIYKYIVEATKEKEIEEALQT
jgi:predicted PurR-regulated permease PerM